MLMKKCTATKREGEKVISTLSPKAQKYYNMTSPLEIYGNKGKYDLYGANEDKGLTKKELNDLFEACYNEIRNANIKEGEDESNKDALYTIADLMQLFNISRASVYNYIKKGIITGNYSNKQRYFTQKEYLTLKEHIAKPRDLENNTQPSKALIVGDTLNRANICYKILTIYPEGVSVKRIDFDRDGNEINFEEPEDYYFIAMKDLYLYER